VADRAELERALEEGHRVDVAGRTVKKKAELPPGDELEGVVTHDPQGRLTREGMELAIDRGGSVLLPGTEDPITSKAHLPTAAELARGDERRAATVRQGLMAQQAQIQAELAKLDTPRPDAPPGAIQQPPQPQQPQTPQSPQTSAPTPAPQPRPAPRAARPLPPTGRDKEE
jgi:hypothetical protein